MPVVALSGVVDVDPGALGEGDFATCGSLLHHWCDHDVVAPQVLVGDAVVATHEVVALVEAQRTHHGKALAGVLPGKGVVVGQPAITLTDDAQWQVAILGVVIGLGKLL